MPYVNIKVTREGTTSGQQGVTPEQKAALLKGVSDLLFEVLNKPPAVTFVVIDEVEMENWDRPRPRTPDVSPAPGSASRFRVQHQLVTNVFGEVIDQRAHGGRQTPAAGEDEVHHSLRGVPVRQYVDEPTGAQGGCA